MKDIKSVSTKCVSIIKISDANYSSSTDMLSVEDPLEIKIKYGTEKEITQKNISVTMRTPGQDIELAIGFLFTEGIISAYDAILNVFHSEMECASKKQNSVVVVLKENILPHLSQADRNFYTTSSCGVCGKSSIESIKTVSAFEHLNKPLLKMSSDVFFKLAKKLHTAQSDFTATGGIHAAGIFNLDGDLILLQEDVGRHNALDKLIGRTLMEGLLPLNKHILLLSGRASFELIQKAAMAGIAIVASIGAPSSLAVELATEFDITLIGFLKENRFNIYHSSKKTLLEGTIKALDKELTKA